MLTVRDLRKTYRGSVALDGVSLQVAAGEVVVLMGPSGCGKSTLIRCVNRLTEPDSGDVLLDGVSLVNLSPPELNAVRRRIGFVFQHFHLIQRLKAWENVSLALLLGGTPRAQARSVALEALAEVGLEAKVERRPGELSGGEQQRVGIARALVGRPDYMLWDEPTASLDPIRVQEVLDVMEGLVAQSRAGMLIVTHEIPFALRAADRLVLMDRGRIVEEGEPAAVLARPRSEIGQAYARLAARRYAS